MQKMIIAAILVLPLSAIAGVYKCPGPDGSPVFQQVPCASGEDTGIATHGNDVMDREEACRQSWRRTRSMRDTAEVYQSIHALRSDLEDPNTSTYERSRSDKKRSVSDGAEDEFEKLNRTVRNCM